MIDYIVFPSSYFSITKVDEDLKEEYDAVLATGLFQVALFGNDKWFNEETLIVRDARRKNILPSTVDGCSTTHHLKVMGL